MCTVVCYEDQDLMFNEQDWDLGAKAFSKCIYDPPEGSYMSKFPSTNPCPEFSNGSKLLYKKGRE